MSQFKKCDTVRLKSGGPLMTVTNRQSSGDVWCEWFDREQDYTRNRFHQTRFHQTMGCRL
ncbi:YodC family protein [Rhodopseudomonas palustris]|uniref:YodC family protein n=1 Tax=Rhodopseudomonas palustris TaxID=1076 RepID=UPI0009B5CA73|nr:DUF2158 domain-containing protein [Rhodopseudomonas palustris]